MPIIASVLPFGEEGKSLHSAVEDEHQIPSSKQEKEDTDSGFGDFEEFDGEETFEENHDMEGSMQRRTRREKIETSPLLPPPRNEKRNAQMIKNSNILELRTIDDIKTPRVVEQHALITDPHELYLSSEEEGSLTDDYEGSLFDFDDEETDNPLDESEQATTHSRTSSRGSQAESARVISFIVVGKPQIVNIHIPSTAPASRTSTSTQKPHAHSLSFDLNNLTNDSFSRPRPVATRRPTPLKLYPSSLRRMSISSITSISTHASSIAPSQQSHISQAGAFHPRRLASNLNSLLTSTKNSLQQKSQSPQPSHHSFLDSDPFASHEPDESHPRWSTSTTDQPDYEPTHRPITPKTPSSLAAAAWRRGLNRTLSIAKKPSAPLLNVAAGAHRDSSKLDLSQIAADSSTGRQDDGDEGSVVRISTEPRSPRRSSHIIEEMRRAVGVSQAQHMQSSLSMPREKEREGGKEKEKGRRAASISAGMAMIGLGRRRGVES